MNSFLQKIFDTCTSYIFTRKTDKQKICLDYFSKQPAVGEPHEQVIAKKTRYLHQLHIYSEGRLNKRLV